ncbi:unnamed protein product [Adineta ricciae]|uniref:G-protein coupled receptors family 1 profile domain-containing protein n=1 Tax=Adineta ricciae TaxID=249248 RepID=A0A814T7U0_ADIRI|nr:unnamed protein product [Adineta ricciae]CAF1182770.1 unnamed protein product [Adineta ricciae]
MLASSQTLSSFNLSSTKSIIDDLNLVQQRFVNQLPLIITVLGLIGFIGNLFTFLQPKLRNNSFCIYTLTASFIDIINLFVNLFPQYLNPTSDSASSFISDKLICKLRLFSVVFFPQLSLDLLMMSLIDRYACTFDPTSRMSRLIRLKTVPWMIFITTAVSCVASLYSPLTYDIIPGYGCGATNPTANAIAYISIHGILTPLVMLIFVFFTYRNIVQHRQRAGGALTTERNRRRNHFIGMVFAQVFVSSFFVLLWIGVYWYFLTIQNSNQSAEEWAIVGFLMSLTNNLYYLIHVRSFYLSTLTSNLFRKTMIAGVLKLFSQTLYHRWRGRNAFISNLAVTMRVGQNRQEDTANQLRSVL